MEKIVEHAPLPAIDGYVVEVEKQDGYMSVSTGYNSPGYVLPDGYIGVTFHDAHGEECYLFMPDPSEED